MAKQEFGINPNIGRWFRFYGFIAFMMAFFPSIFAETVLTNATREYAIKAAFTFNFAKFTKWPDGAYSEDDDYCRLCVVGGEEVEAAFQSVSGEKIGTRKLRVLFVKTPQEMVPCRMLFISRTVKASDVLQILRTNRF